MNSQEEKVHKLREYTNIVGRINWLVEEKLTLRQKLEGLGAQNLDGMPKQSGYVRNDKTEEILDKLTEIDKSISDELSDLKSAREKITNAINQIEDPILKRVLQLRYLEYDKNGKRLSWEEISEKMGYSWRHIYRLHSQALDVLNDVIL